MQPSSPETSDPIVAAPDPAWRRVGAGLGLLALAWSAIVLSNLLVIVFGCLLILWGDDLAWRPWLWRLAVWTLGVYYLGCLGLLFWGLGLCAWATPNVQARRPAQAAVLLLAFGLPLFGLWHAFNPFRYSVPDGFSRWTAHGITLAMDLLILAIFVLAGLAWSQFLKEVALCFERQDLAKQASRYAVALSIFSGAGITYVGLDRFHMTGDLIETTFVAGLSISGFALYALVFFHLAIFHQLVSGAGTSQQAEEERCSPSPPPP